MRVTYAAICSRSTQLIGGLALVLVVLPGCARLGKGSSATGMPQGALVETTVHGTSLEGNLLGVSPDRTVAVYLPAGYARGTQRYPVLYVLHGIFDSHRTWTEPWQGTASEEVGYATIQALMDRGVSSGRLREMIVVVLDAEKTCHYTDSPVKGGWTEFVARDLVAYIDEHFRTMAEPRARALLGHSMGGHGALKVAMLRPGVFGSLYAMSPSLLDLGGDVSVDNPAIARAAGLRTLDEVSRAGFYEQAVVGVSQCFTPDVNHPLRAALPFVTGPDGRATAGPALAQWTAQLPVRMAPARADALRQLSGIRFDAGLADEFAHIPPGARRLSEVLDSLGVQHTFELYNGDHRNRLWGRGGRLNLEVLPWLSNQLATQQAVSPSPTDAAGAQARLWRASQQGDLRTALAAVRAGADVNALDTTLSRTGRRPLNYAAENDLVAMIEWLVAQGADVNRANLAGFTPLHHAAEYGKLAAARALLAAGADRNARLPSGSTPAIVARQRGHLEVARLLER